MNPWFTDYSQYLATLFPGVKVQKISVNTDRGCPNRDGTLGSGGCIYCNNQSFTPAYCFGVKGITAQLEAGKKFFARKYPQMKYLAYFQSFSSTYGRNAADLKADLTEALDVEDVIGIVVGTRPDCVPDAVLDVLTEIGHKVPVIVEFGMESLHDRTLRLINRGHDAATAVGSVSRAARRGLHVGVHLIAGLPGESESDILATVDAVCRLPVESIKMHQLQVLRDTPLADMIDRGEVTLEPYTYEQYLELCEKIVHRVPRHIAIDRFLSTAPPEMVVMPKWGVKNYVFTDMLLKRLAENKLPV
ncbi:MAG: TIGR01212 family radical SAM protein [Bacteroidales bacterium]|nr:TIGR01212 family radical SAM protein [Bacteroidales bacterium]